MTKAKVDRGFRQLAKVLGEEKTLELLELLAHQPLQKRDILKALDLPVNTGWRKLTILRNLGLVQTREEKRDKRTVAVYSLTDFAGEVLALGDKYERAMIVEPEPLPGQQRLNHYRNGLKNGRRKP